MLGTGGGPSAPLCSPPEIEFLGNPAQNGYPQPNYGTAPRPNLSTQQVRYTANPVAASFGGEESSVFRPQLAMRTSIHCPKCFSKLFEYRYSKCHLAAVICLVFLLFPFGLLYLLCLKRRRYCSMCRSHF